MRIRVPKIRGTLFRGPHNKDYSILGSIFGVPLFWETPMWSGSAFVFWYFAVSLSRV